MYKGCAHVQVMLAKAIFFSVDCHYCKSNELKNETDKRDATGLP